MKVMFNGVIERSRSGCKCKGRTTENKFVTSKMYILPSGARKTFRVGTAVEVLDMDAEFLLSYTYTDPQGNVRKAFEVV